MQPMGGIGVAASIWPVSVGNVLGTIIAWELLVYAIEDNIASRWKGFRSKV